MTGEPPLPQGLQDGVEALSGLSMDGVKVHRNSDRPSGLKPDPDGEGRDIHVGAGQEEHLPHEHWAVVKPTKD